MTSLTSLLVYGVNHQTTPLDRREQLAFTKEKAKQTLQELLQIGAANEAMILSTCNRVELYTQTQNPDLFQEWVKHHSKLPLSACVYVHQEKQAVQHLMRVASGLDSMSLGENYILKQIKDAYQWGLEVGSIGSQLQRLLQRVFNVSKQVRQETDLGVNPITVGFAVVTLAKQIFTDLAKSCVLLIGAGDMIELTALHLYNQGIKRFIIANRSAEKAERLAKKVYGHWIPMADIPLYLKESDIVISATSSELPILGKGAIERAIKARKRRPIFMVDLAVPRDIEPEVENLEDIYLYNMDDLEPIIASNHHSRQNEAKQAEAIIELAAQHFIKDLQALDSNNLIKQYRSQLDQLAEKELQRANLQLTKGVDATHVLQQFAQSLMNKVSHHPCIKMKQAAYDGRFELLALARSLLDLE